MFLSISPFPNKPWFLRVFSTSLLKTLLGKGEIARNEQFLLFPLCFLPFWITFRHFNRIKNSCLQTLSVWKSLKFVVWERVKEPNNFLGKMHHGDTLDPLLVERDPLLVLFSEWIHQLTSNDLFQGGFALLIKKTVQIPPSIETNALLKIAFIPLMGRWTQ